MGIEDKIRILNKWRTPGDEGITHINSYQFRKRNICNYRIMAGIDKTYISSYEDYKKIIDWCKGKSFTLKDGSVIIPSNYIYSPDITEEQWNVDKKAYEDKYKGWTYERVLWNTPTYFDIWLIRNCPFDFIQERLKEQYGGSWSKAAFTEYNDTSLYEQIKNGTSIFDTYQRNGLGWKSKVKFHKIAGTEIRDKNVFYWIDINPYWLVKNHDNTTSSYNYNERTDSWNVYEEALPWTSSALYHGGYLSNKKIVRMIKKWNFPKGTIVNFTCFYKGKRGRRLFAKAFYVTIS